MLGNTLNLIINIQLKNRIKKPLIIRRKKSDYNSKNTGHAFVAGFILAILVQNSYTLNRDPFMLKKVQSFMLLE